SSPASAEKKALQFVPVYDILSFIESQVFFYCGHSQKKSGKEVGHADRIAGLWDRGQSFLCPL
ncbi:MAG: hypothetical protein IJI97_02110, partial [Clostridia bacterium]|nr:hypothetical protein [Clostridia bacterium]